MNKTINTQTLPGFLNGRGIGFERMFDMIDEVSDRVTTSSAKYPPYNLVQVSDDDFEVDLAVAGFTLEEMEITQDGNKLTIAGEHIDPRGSSVTYLHRGISAREFTREFVLAEYMTVVGAKMKDGILNIKLHRDLPEAMKPRTIKIK
jgi:molecular chaperone IbpA